MLQQTGKFNDFSPTLTKKIEKLVESFGTKVRYRFDIERPNPDTTNYNGKTVFPSTYTLDPAHWVITDKDEDRPNKTKSKTVAIVDSSKDTVDEITKQPRVWYGRIRINATEKGILELNLEIPEDVEKCIAIELHPKTKDGLFQDKNLVPVVARIDEARAATEEREGRSLRLKAMNIAQQMSDKQLIDFADAMQWSSSQEPSVIANLVETLAEEDPKFFTDLINGADFEYRTTVQRAMNKSLISFDPADYRFFWTGNSQPIVSLSPVGEKSEIEKLASWLIGQPEVYKKLKSLTEGKEKVATV